VGRGEDAAAVAADREEDPRPRRVVAGVGRIIANGSDTTHEAHVEILVTATESRALVDLHTHWALGELDNGRDGARRLRADPGDRHGARAAARAAGVGPPPRGGQRDDVHRTRCS
jgi:hypothetical protein